MSHNTTNDAGTIKEGVTAKAQQPRDTAAAANVKDAGRVRIGGAMLRFGVKDAGRVHIGGAMLRF